jgi:hypothetical protein
MGHLITYDAKVEKVRLCPSAGTTNRTDVGGGAGACDTAWCWSSTTPYILGSYQLNGWIYSGAQSEIAQYRTDVSAAEAVGYVFNKEATVQKPSLTPVLTDAVWVDSWPMEYDPPNQNLYLAGGTANPPTLARCVTPRHGSRAAIYAPQSQPINAHLAGGIDVAIFDGHVQYTPLEQLWQLYWHLDWNPPSRRPGT